MARAAPDLRASVVSAAPREIGPVPIAPAFGCAAPRLRVNPRRAGALPRDGPRRILVSGERTEDRMSGEWLDMDGRRWIPVGNEHWKLHEGE